jgi:hypothetical protein
MFMSIVRGTPSWVWSLLAALLMLGLWQRRARRVRPAAVLALPLALLALGLGSMAAGLVAQPLAALSWLAALATGLWLTRQWPAPRGARWLADEGRLELPGSWAPMALMLAIFALRFGSGVAQALHPEWRSALAFQTPLALSFGGLAGAFLGRALALLGLARPAAAVGTRRGGAASAPRELSAAAHRANE